MDGQGNIHGANHRHPAQPGPLCRIAARGPEEERGQALEASGGCAGLRGWNVGRAIRMSQGQGLRNPWGGPAHPRTQRRSLPPALRFLSCQVGTATTLKFIHGCLGSFQEARHQRAWETVQNTHCPCPLSPWGGGSQHRQALLRLIFGL